MQKGSVTYSEAPLVSVIIPTHNRAGMLCRAIDSVLHQTFTDFELIIVDDGSTDETQQRIHAYTAPRIRYFRHEVGKGASAARNTGMHQARGQYIAFLDDDDEWLPAKLEKQIPVLQQAPEQVGIVYCWMDYYRDGKLINKRHPRLRGHVFAQVLDRQRLTNSSTLLVPRRVIEDVGGFDESLPRGNDGDFIRRVCLEYEVDLIPEVLVKVYVDHGHEQITRFDESGIRNHIYAQLMKVNKFGSELQRYPKQAAHIYANIGHYYSLLGEWRNAIAFYRKAIMTFPFSAKVYINVLHSLNEVARR